MWILIVQKDFWGREHFFSTHGYYILNDFEKLNVRDTQMSVIH